MIPSAWDEAGAGDGAAGWTFAIEGRLRELSAQGGDLERVDALVDFAAFRPELERARPRSDRARGGRAPYDHGLMFRILILQASRSLSDERTECLVKDRLSARTLPRADAGRPGSGRDLDLKLP